MSSKPNTDTMQREIQHNEAKHRFEYVEEEQLCVLDYSLDGTVAVFFHTGVPSVVGGRGIAADLVRYGLETARARGWQVVPECSYVDAYIRRHSEYQDLVAG
ncbi:GNAT family N-acetyltransferase [Castellaniella sp.]|uniref:GNAT family N-acetyltransferase n=1 Tax=Castellaniella sp. TaxID=1955812 RepID=UPI003A90021D